MDKANVSKTKRGLDTRESIIKETYQILLEQNHTEVTLDYISEKAGIAKTSILWHFGSKDALFLEVIETGLKEFEKKILDIQMDENDILKKLRLFLDNYRILIEENPKIFALYFNLIFDRKMYNQFTRRIQQMVDLWRQMIVKHLNFISQKKANSIASCLIAFVDGVYIQYYIDPEKFNLKNAMNTMKAMIINDEFLKLIAHE